MLKVEAGLLRSMERVMEDNITLIVTPGATLSEVEQTYVQFVVKRERSITRAAKILGLGRSTLHRRLQKYKGEK